MATKPKLDADLSGEPVDQTDYRSKIGYQATDELEKTPQRGLKGIFRILKMVSFTWDCCTSGGIQFLGDKLVSWMSKKQDCTAMSSAEAEYVALSASCAQVMWMRTQLQDYGFNYNKNTVVLLISQLYAIPNIMQPRASTPVPSISILTALPKKGFRSRSDELVMRMLTHCRMEFEIASSLGLIGDDFVLRKNATKIELTLEQSQHGVSNDVLNHNVDCDSEDDIMGPSDAMLKPSQPIRVYLKRKLVSFVTEITHRLLLTFNPRDSLNLPDHRIHKDGDGDASFQLKSDSLPHAHAQTTKTFHKHHDSRIMKAQELKTKTSAQTLIYKIFLQRFQVYQGRLLASFQDDAKYEHVGQDTVRYGGNSRSMTEGYRFKRSRTEKEQCSKEMHKRLSQDHKA
ncbi:hypothetical protein Tco_0552276 [Tanacetum coccineum]